MAPRAETPAPNGGGNGRGRSRARRTQRSASPGVRSTASTYVMILRKGNSKGKFGGRKKGCMYSNQGKGSCLKADRCTCYHDPNIAVYVPKGKSKGKRKGSNSPRSASPAGRGGAIPPEVVRPLYDRAEDAL